MNLSARRFKCFSACCLTVVTMLSASFMNNATAGTVYKSIRKAPSDAPYVLITDYGAIGDGNIANANVNATAMANALATGKTVKIPYTAAGYHFGANQITVGTGQIIEGES